MKNIIILTTADLINPEMADQPFSRWRTKHIDIHALEQNADVIVMNGRYIKNRYGNTTDEVDLNVLTSSPA